MCEISGSEQDAGIEREGGGQAEGNGRARAREMGRKTARVRGELEGATSHPPTRSDIEASRGRYRTQWGNTNRQPIREVVRCVSNQQHHSSGPQPSSCSTELSQ